MTRKTTAYARKRAAGHAARRGDGISITRMHNTRLTRTEIARIMLPCWVALQAVREGRITYKQWVVLCTAAHVARAIEDLGVIRGQREIIDDAERALDDIGQRCGATASAWKPKACTGPAITALADLVSAHSRQVHELTYGEYTAAADKAVARVATDGGQVFRMEATDALGKLDEGCRDPGWRGWENGHGEQVGDAAQDAREALAAQLIND